MKTARYSEPAKGGVRCLLCPHACLLKEGETGRCHSRTVLDGVLRAAGYGQVPAAHLDPIEKKPLYHFYPGTELFSIGGWGCNLQCQFCQNWTLSQTVKFDPLAAWSVRDVLEHALAGGGIGVAYTYNEPLINVEFVYDCAVALHAAGLKNVLVTNGYTNATPAEEILPYIDAVNLDIKSMENSFYRDICGGSLAPVLRFARQVVAGGVHLEVTNLVIPGLNSDDRQIDMLASWIAETLGTAVPLHLTAYRPEYRMQRPPTGAADLHRVFERARRTLTHVYTGNLNLSSGRDTVCGQCGAMLVLRKNWFTRIENLSADGHCSVCGAASGVIV